jgi:transposase
MRPIESSSAEVHHKRRRLCCATAVTTSIDLLPDDPESLKRLLLAREGELVVARAHAATVTAEAATLRAKAADDQALIAHLKLQIETLKRDRFGQRSERSARLLDQLELQLEELEATATEDELAAEVAVARTTSVAAFTRKRPARKPFPAHLPRERVIVAGPTACACCGSDRLAKIGEDITETLEVVPRQWKVIQTVREKFTCRACESIGQAPAPFHVIPRGWAGPSLLAMILFEKYGQHQPLNRQAERYAREGVPLSLSTLADQVGACCAALQSIHQRLAAHVLDAGRLHGDDTTVPVLAKGKTVTGRCWTYVRDDRPFGGRAPPAALFFYSRDRSGEHPQRHLASYSGILQADAYGGYGKLYADGRSAGPILEAACWSHARRKFFVLADIEASARRRAQRRTPAVVSPIALDAVRRIDALFELERSINGLPADRRLAVRRQQAAPLVAALEAWMREERRKLSRHSDVAVAMDYMLKRWHAFARFLDDGRICLSNNAAERALRGIALGRKAWLFAGSDRGGDRAAVMYSLIVTAKLNDIDPQAWLADVLARIAEHPVQKLNELMPWNWRRPATVHVAAAA